MEITVRKTVKEKVVVTLPAYYKTIAHQFKIYSDNNCICVSENDIKNSHAELPFNVDAIPSTEEDFLTMFNETKTKLCQLATL